MSLTTKQCFIGPFSEIKRSLAGPDVLRADLALCQLKQSLETSTKVQYTLVQLLSGIVILSSSGNKRNVQQEWVKHYGQTQTQNHIRSYILYIHITNICNGRIK